MKLIKGMPTRHWHKAEWLRIAQEKAKGSAEKGPRTKGHKFFIKLSRLALFPAFFVSAVAFFCFQ